LKSRKVFILSAEDPKTLGGAEHFVRELVTSLETRGYQVEVFHRGNSGPEWLALPRGRFVKKLAGTLCGYWIGRAAQQHLNEDVAAVISNSDVGYYPLSRGAVFPKIHFYHGTYRAQAEAIRPFIKRTGYLYLKWWNSMMLERLSGRGKLVLCNSDQTCLEVKSFFGLNSIAMWLPIDTARFKPLDVADCRASLNLPQGSKIGLFVGSVHPMKGLSVVQSLINLLPEVHWLLALRGDLPTGRFGGPNATILQNVSRDQIPLLYGAADFSICPSLYEPFGYVVAESLACGTPVIATPGGASRAFLEYPPLERLLISDPSAVDQFVAAAGEVMRAPEIYRRAIEEFVRPKLNDLMSHENWSRRFFQLTGL
jgi:glycosyltransferase involved in cell wall biosynthesis